jgi:hypothetical protein
VGSSMPPRDERRRYAEAFYHGVVRQNLSFQRAEEFAAWWSRHGYLTHKRLADGWLNWYTRGFGRVAEDDNGGEQ